MVGSTPLQVKLYSVDSVTQAIKNEASGTINTNPISDFVYFAKGTRLITVHTGGLIKLFSVARENSNLTFTELSSDIVPDAPNVSPNVCISPDGSNAHYVRYGSNKIDSFKLLKDELSYVGTVNTATWALTCTVSTDSKYLFTAGFDGGIAQSFTIDGNGALTLASVVGGLNDPGWIAKSEDSKFVFVVEQATSSIVALEVDSTTGFLTQVDRKTTQNTEPDFIDARENGSQIYIHGFNKVVLIHFDRTTKKFTNLFDIIPSDPSQTWFKVGKTMPFIFLPLGVSNTNVFPLKEDGTLVDPAPAAALTGENSVREIGSDGGG